MDKKEKEKDGGIKKEERNRNKITGIAPEVVALHKLPTYRVSVSLIFHGNYLDEQLDMVPRL